MYRYYQSSDLASWDYERPPVLLISKREAGVQAWFYDLEGSGGQLLAEHDYLGSVEAMHLNADWAAALFEGICCSCDVHWKQVS